MSTKEIYQTLEDRNNPKKVVSEGPFICRRKGAWLGDGYYFWESFIENAHWWGCEGANYNNEYIICKAYYDFDESSCFNLIDNYNHIKRFNYTLQLMQSQDILKKDNTVRRVISHLKDTLKIFQYKATRIYGVHSKKKDSPYMKSLPFVKDGFQYLDLSPAIQICFYSKDALNLRGYEIVYPDKYIDDYVV